MLHISTQSRSCARVRHVMHHDDGQVLIQGQKTSICDAYGRVYCEYDAHLMYPSCSFA